MDGQFKLAASHAREGAKERLAPARRPWLSTLPTNRSMRSMSSDEIGAFVSSRGFGVLALADANHAFGVPLFYGARGDTVFFQTRSGAKSRYLESTSEACLTISSTRGTGDWASVQLFGVLESVDADGLLAPLVDVPPPLEWADDDPRARDERAAGVSTFRLVPTLRVGRYSRPAALSALDSEAGFAGM